MQPGSFSNLIELLQYRAQNQSHRNTYTFLEPDKEKETSMTYADLDQKARVIGAALQQLGCVGKTVMLVYESGLDYISAFFGCLYAGAIAVPVHPPLNERMVERLKIILKDSNASYVLTNSRTVSDWGSAQWLETCTLDPNLGKDWKNPKVQPETLAFLQYTSGSTGNPRGVMVSHGSILANEEMIRRAFRYSEDDVFVSWLPLFHDMGLIGSVLQPLYSGFPMFFMTPMDFIKRPIRWLSAISKYRGTTSTAPNFAYELCVNRIREEDKAKLDLSSWRAALNGSEPVRAETMNQFFEAFKSCGFKKESFCPCYGLAEATLLVSGNFTGKAPQYLQVEDPPSHTKYKQLVNCGKPAWQTSVIIVDPQSMKPCGQNQIGEIWIQGPAVAQGYFNKPEKTKEVFQAYTAEGAGPFLRTGDLGFLDEGELYVTGRIKDLVIIRGRNYYPQDIEWIIQECAPELRQDCVAAFPIEENNEEKLCIVAEIRNRIRRDQYHEIMERCNERISEEFGIVFERMILIKQGTIFKTTSGKIQRQDCKRAFLSLTLNVVAEYGQGTRFKKMAQDIQTCSVS